ncbi:hypothetical protein TPHA_0D04240 [Tetrapisispora phaffii CBS 4417]|uniref:Pre-mRNA-splicing factor SYF2 n=1 Tax=Tetrapisispora phaffii (strain ATCC 24235 / CBS 4417 / NBRC 1672 / NRRL Y-8282 / UCD 70-5) TaxID=1071381 RepID=G8BRY3_TETPH|nr:hypothetical protein TPHA_0D04240 [Tetrapisispora phaffii CBS 4417]CCE63058.1 hypothetical protein TPHA_0D04240 [Tetrapisispora phaffii CBS 4417]
MDMVSLIDEFKVLKKQALDSLIEDRKFLEADEKERKSVLKPKVYSINMDDDGDGDAGDDLLTNNSERALLTYTIRDYEEWEESLKRKHKNVTNTSTSSSSQQQTAKFTYDKEIHRMKKRQGKFATDEEITRGSAMKEVLDDGKLLIKDDKHLVNGFISDINKVSNDRYIKRMKLNAVNNDATGSKVSHDKGKTSYNNAKNKDFNDKLEG